MHDSKLARNNAQLRQIIRDGRCVHPIKSQVFTKLVTIITEKHETINRGCIRYCSDCQKILYIEDE
jgi:hypothetical protein